jgi:hypothetical protein
MLAAGTRPRLVWSDACVQCLTLWGRYCYSQAMAPQEVLDVNATIDEVEPAFGVLQQRRVEQQAPRLPIGLGCCASMMLL